MKQLWAEAFLILVFMGCEFFSIDRSIQIHLPEVPPSWKELDVIWEFSYGMNEKLIFQEELQCKFIDLKIPKGITQIFLLTPRFHSLDLKPAGGYILSNEENNIILLTWENGWLAQVLDRVQKSGGTLEYFNIRKIESSLSNKRGSSSPWSFDQELFLLELQDLRGNYFSFQKNEIFVKLQVPEGIWFNVDPLSDCLEGPNMVEKFVPAGINYYISPNKLWIFQSTKIGSLDYIINNL